MHVVIASLTPRLESTFAPNTQWTEEYATGPEILKSVSTRILDFNVLIAGCRYWESVARKYDIYSKTRFRTKVLGCYWEPEEAKWRIEIEDLRTGQRTSEHFDFLVTAIGHFNKFRIPTYPGIDTYKGKLMHSSAWDPDFDPKGKRIATIGNGASGIQVTTEIRKTAAHVDHYARSKTWIAGSFQPAAKERSDEPMYISEEQKQSFKDPDTYLQYRKGLEGTFWKAFSAQIADSETTKATTENFTELMRKRLVDDPSLLEKLVPDFPPHCRRLTPGPGYLEALTKPNLSFIQTPIKEFTETGITTIDGVHREVDAVICSTGANTDFAPPFPIVSGEYDLSRDWKPEGKFGWPFTYLGMGTPGFPNLGFLLGPNSAGPSGTVPYAVESMVTYVAQILRKMSRQGIRTMTPSKEAADAFVQYSDAFFPRTNLARKCSSWSNGGRPGARIHGHWPGSAAHLAHVRREPRWEDFEYTYERPENRFSYLGNGWTKREVEEESDLTPYLRLPGDNDLRLLHERWYDF